MNKSRLIQAYFSGVLSPEEQLQFKKLLENDLEFRKEVEFQKDLQAVIKNKERNALKQQLQQLEEETPVASTRKYYLWKPLQIAASFVLLIASGWLLYNTFSTVDLEALYTSNYEKYPNTYVTITRGDNEEDSELLEAFEAYEANESKKAITLLKKICLINQGDEIDFYLAQSYIQAGELPLASRILKELIHENSKFMPESMWYLGLIYLKNKDVENTRQILQKLIKNGGYKKEQAQELLEQIN